MPELPERPSNDEPGNFEDETGLQEVNSSEDLGSRDGFMSVEEFFAQSSEEQLPPGFRSGFVSLMGRPNVGKSTLLNRILGRKVSIVSDKPQTTRNQIRGVLNRPSSQIVFVDTPGIHKPRTAMGERLNDAALGSATAVDVVCLLVDATAPVGSGDQWVADRVPSNAIIIVNKCDLVDSEAVMKQLLRASEFDRSAYFPISAATGRGVDVLVDHLEGLMPEGPRWYPLDTVTDVEEAFWVAELVREKLLALTHDELPHSIACRVTEWDWPRVRCEILVERESQKGIVIGKKGSVLKQVGIAARAQMREGAFLELHVKVDRDWQRKAKSLDRLGY